MNERLNHSAVWMFSGQGSQFANMGWELFRARSEFRYWLERLDQVALQYLGESILTKIYRSHTKILEREHFAQTLFTHPALFMVQYALARELLTTSEPPLAVMGLSLGELVAAAVSDVATPEALLQHVIYQAQALDAYCQPGGMVTVLASPYFYALSPELSGICELVAVNYEKHIVISGDETAIQAAIEYLKRRSVTHYKLAVSHGFHSYAIDVAEDAYTKAEAKCHARAPYRVPTIPFFSCCEGTLLKHVGKAHFWNAIRMPILFAETLQAVDQYAGNTKYLDLGPTPTLAGFVKNNLKRDSSSSFHVATSLFGTKHLRRAGYAAK